MTRSILWISSSAPSSLLPTACAALPQPRSRIALAAETRAAWVASFERMTPTRTLIAVLVWLRANERISVSVLDISLFWDMVFRWRVFARRRVGMVHGAIAGPWDNGAHDNPSAMTMATRPVSASEISYAVICWPLPEITCAARSRSARSFRARTLSLANQGAAASVAFATLGQHDRRAHAATRNGTDDDALSDDARGRVRRPACAPPSDWQTGLANKKPAAVSGAGFEVLAMMSLCQ
jgi:hypothetical protein